MNIKDNAIALSFSNRESVVYINLSTYRGKDKDDKKNGILVYAVSTLKRTHWNLCSHR